MKEDTVYDNPESLYTKASGFVPETKVSKPWGWEQLLVATPDYAMKFLFIKAGERLSVQYHKRKRETLHCLEGRGKAFLGKADDPKNLREEPFEQGQTLHIEPLTVHTYEAVEDMLIVEVSTPHIDDVVRIEDRYGRAN